MHAHGVATGCSVRVERALGKVEAQAEHALAVEAGGDAVTARGVPVQIVTQK